MQNKQLLFNIFTLLTSLSLSNVNCIATNAVYRHIKLLRTSLWQNAITHCRFSPCLCLFIFCCHTVLWTGGEQDSPSAIHMDRRLSTCLENWTITSSLLLFFLPPPSPLPPHNAVIMLYVCIQILFVSTENPQHQSPCCCAIYPLPTFCLKTLLDGNVYLFKGMWLTDSPVRKMTDNNDHTASSRYLPSYSRSKHKHYNTKYKSTSLVR